ncbi:MAG TPA: di-heme oxidoredictase family protein [Kofleriaceae bacterium]|jgi:YVTN family beta-propeller protein
MFQLRAASLAIVAALAACKGPLIAIPTPDAAATTNAPSLAHSSSIALSADGTRLYVVNADADSISAIDTSERTLIATFQLAPPPAAGSDGSYTPSVMPRALALSSDGGTLYATGERSGLLYAIDLASSTQTSVAVCSEPIGVVTDGAGNAYVACSQDRLVAKVTNMQVAGTVSVAGEPWALAWLPDGTLLATLFLGPGAAQLDPNAMAVLATWTIPDTAPRGDPRLAHGQVRGIYDAAMRPTSDEVWFTHAMLGTDTAQPTLDFERTAFPSISIATGSGAYSVTLSTDAQDVPGIDGSFGDVVSGPHAIAFTSDGSLALMVDTNSEDVLVVGGDHTEHSLVRPLPGHMPEGIAISPDDTHAYVDERNTGDIAVLDIGSDGTVAVDGAPIPRLTTDPMPTQLRLGQQLFYSANSDEYPITTNHWVACATCHMEGRSDAVTWKFAQGPRDTPTNAGGMTNTGFLFRTADRNQVQDYWKTIDVEQGGDFDPATQATLLDAIAAYVNLAIPLPVPPATDPMMVARGEELFDDPTVGCSGCHNGPRFTDSGMYDPTLDLTQPTCGSPPAAPCVLLHDVGTCNTGAYPDVMHDDIDNDPRAACMFDTPSLSGVWSTPPYLHDGTAATLMDVLEQTRGKMGDITGLSAADEAALVEYLRSL